MSSLAPRLTTSSAAAKCEKLPMAMRTTLQAVAFIALGAMSIAYASATPIDPSGSVNINLPPPGTVTSNSPDNRLLMDSTVTVRGQRVVGNLASTGTGPYNLGISTGDPASIVSSGIYRNGDYSAPTSLEVAIDGLIFDYNQVTAQYSQVGQSAFQTFAFSGLMQAGTNSVTGQDYNPAPSLFSFELTQAGTNGGAINYGVNLIVPDDVTVPEPTSLALLGGGLIAVGVSRRQFGAASRVSLLVRCVQHAGRDSDIVARPSRAQQAASS